MIQVVHQILIRVAGRDGFRRAALRIGAGVLILAAVGCASSPSESPPKPGGWMAGDGRSLPPGIPLSRRQKRIYDEVQRWIGVPYRYGGTERSGVDCSGLTLRIYQAAFGIHLPRSTSEQMRVGHPAPPHRLLAGDLVFFSIRRNLRHVGIYIADQYFAHASTSMDGVIISSLNNPYWRKVYKTARRVLKPEPQAGGG